MINSVSKTNDDIFHDSTAYFLKNFEILPQSQQLTSIPQESKTNNRENKKTMFAVPLEVKVITEISHEIGAQYDAYKIYETHQRLKEIDETQSLNTLPIYRIPISENKLYKDSKNNKYKNIVITKANVRMTSLYHHLQMYQQNRNYKNPHFTPENLLNIIECMTNGLNSLHDYYKIAYKTTSLSSSEVLLAGEFTERNICFFTGYENADWFINELSDPIPFIKSKNSDSTSMMMIIGQMYIFLRDQSQPLVQDLLSAIEATTTISTESPVNVLNTFTETLSTLKLKYNQKIEDIIEDDGPI